MEYQLVLQFPGDSIINSDAMIELENTLISVLGNSADVDGHDCGSGEANIFILTDDPLATFGNLKGVLIAAKVIDTVTVAHRRLDEEDYSVIWPQGYSGVFAVT